MFNPPTSNISMELNWLFLPTHLNSHSNIFNGSTRRPLSATTAITLWLHTSTTNSNYHIHATNSWLRQSPPMITPTETTFDDHLRHSPQATNSQRRPPQMTCLWQPTLTITSIDQLQNRRGRRRLRDCLRMIGSSLQTCLSQTY